ncbi:MAG TPA: inorganic diphosphatase [Longimicrobiales bacterium]
MTLHLWHDLPSGTRPPQELNAIIEIPRGSRNKYELDKETGLFRFDRLLYSAVYYPGDYGFIPRTLADDDDPLDVLVLVTVPTFPGCFMEVRPVGAFEMRDEKGLDEKILAVPVRDPLYDEYHELDDVASHYLREVRHFFAIYKELEGVRTSILGWQDRESAYETIRASCERYREEFGDRAGGS